MKKNLSKIGILCVAVSMVCTEVDILQAGDENEKEFKRNRDIVYCYDCAGRMR